MRVMITGSSGFIAGRFVERLLREGHMVVGMDNKASARTHKNYYEVIHDITQLTFPRDFPYIIDQCFHFAAISNLNYARENILETLRINVYGTAKVIRFCEKQGVKVFNYISTCCVYGNTSEHPTTETAPKEPPEIYAQTKLYGEWMVEHFSDMQYNILRPSTTYGVGMRKELAIHIFLEHALKDEPIPIHGDGLQTRCFVYVDDLVDAFVKVLENGVKNETINLAGAEEISILDVANLCRNLCHSNSALDFVEDRLAQVRKEQIDISKAKKLLGWKLTPLLEGLKQTVEWMKMRKDG